MSCDRQTWAIYHYIIKVLFLSGCGWNLYPQSPLLGQTIADDSLGNESSIVTPDVTVKDDIADLIEGGAIRNSNLFHSFEKFNIPEAKRVYFASPNGIANISTRVTGNNISEIFGTIGVDGAANLWLLNPNGIVFGKNASLDVSGSFLGTTADSYVFGNGFEYSASNPKIPPLLTINIPVGLQFGSQAESILNQSFIHNDFDQLVGLEVPPEENLTLVGGDIVFKGGAVTAPNGLIEIGSVSAHSLVEIIPTENNWQLDYSQVNNYQNLSLVEEALIDSSGNGGGNIQLQGGQISIRDNSNIFADSYGEDSKGILQVNATENLEILGTNEEDLYPTGLYADVFSSGEGNDIKIKTKQLSIREGGIIRAEVFDSGNGGDIWLEAENIAVTTMNVPYSGISTRVHQNATGQGGNTNIKGNELLIENSVLVSDTYGEGDAGLVQIDVDELRVTEGGLVNTATFGSGKGGNILLTAREIEISGTDADGFRSALTAFTNSTGQGGNIIINADKLFATDTASIDASTFSTGNSGDIEINVQQLKIKDDVSQIATATFGSGNAGDLIIRASESVEISGTELASYYIFEDKLFLFSSGLSTSVEPGASGNGGNLTVETDNLNISQGGSIVASTFGQGHAGNINIQAQNIIISGVSSPPAEVHGFEQILPLYSQISATSIGNYDAGLITIKTATLNLSDQGRIAVSSLANGDAGSISITATELNLENAATIEGQVNAGNQGNIYLTTDNIQLRNNSAITVQATGTATGGNLNINNTENMVLLENSQIIADALTGNGGNIEIRTQGLFVSPDSLISASSQFGLDGTVAIDRLNGDRPIELDKLPVTPINVTQKITTGCNLQRSNFAITGRGGLPENPTKNLRSQTVWQDLRLPIKATPTSLSIPQYPPKSNIIEAKTWKINPQGNVELIANAGYSDSFNSFNWYHQCQSN